MDVSTETMSPQDALKHFGVKGMKWGVRNSDSSGGGEAKAPLSTKKKVLVGAGVATAVIGTAAAAYVLRSKGSVSTTQVKTSSKELTRAMDQMHWNTKVKTLSEDIRKATAEQDVISRKNLNSQIGQKITDPDLRKKFGLPA